MGNQYHKQAPVTFAVVQSLGHVQIFETPWTAAQQASLSLTISWSLPKFISIELMMPSNHLILCHPLLLLSSIFPNESAVHIRWPKYWSFSFSISPSNEYSRLISSKIDWFDLLAFQGTLKSNSYTAVNLFPILTCTLLSSRRASTTHVTDTQNHITKDWPSVTFHCNIRQMLLEHPISPSVA